MSTSNSMSAYSSIKSNGTLSAIQNSVLAIYANHPNGLTIKEGTVEWFRLNTSAIRDISGTVVDLFQSGKLTIVGHRGGESVYLLRALPSKLEKIARKLEREKERTLEVQRKTAKYTKQLAKETNNLIKTGMSQSDIDNAVMTFQAQFKGEKRK